MARRRPNPELQKFRRLVRAGKRREAIEFLEETIRENPDNAKAKDELSRHLTNRPFSFEEADIKELQQIIADFVRKPQHLSSLRKNTLKKLRHRTVYLEEALNPMLSVGDKKSLQQLRSAISRDLQRRRKPFSKRSIAAAAAIALLLGCGAAIFFLCQRAGHAAETMASFARKNFECQGARNLLKVHDTGLNRTLNRRVRVEADRLRALISNARKSATEVDAILTEIERGNQSVVGQGVRRRALIERRLRELGRDGLTLQQRWTELCRREQNELKQQRLSLVEELMAPLPTWQGVKGQHEEDIALLKARIKVLQQRLNIYEDAAEALKLDESIIQPAREEMENNTATLKEIQDLRHMLNMLCSAHDYDTYCKYLNDFQPQYYKPGVDMLGIRDNLPSFQSLQGMMQEHGQDLPSGLLQAARESLVDGKPTFSARFPATKEQLHLLDELLTNSALRTCLYELTNVADNLEAYSESLPELRYGRACFMRSSLDPQRDVSDNKAVEWQNPHHVVSRTLDPRPLHQALGMHNDSGFSNKANLPELLTRLLQHHHANVPPLAKAYVFHYLIRVNNESAYPILTGLRYAPEMRKVMTSFDELRESCGVTLDGNCWLRRTPAHAEAERRYAKWFNNHQKVDFSAELKKNLHRLLNVTPRFVGHIEAGGNPFLFEQLKEGQLIWYLSNSATTASTWGEPLQQPMPLSPIFIMDK